MKANKKLKMRFKKSAFEAIKNSIGIRPAETGGLLFGNRKDFIVEKFIFDSEAKVTSSTYTFNTDFLNPMIKMLWETEGLELIGFIHSHPRNFRRPSTPDLGYFFEQFKHIKSPAFLTPIVMSEGNKGDFELLPYFVFKEHPYEYQLGVVEIIDEKKEKDNILQDFSRINGAVDVNKLKETKIVGIGAGGAFSLYQALARTGVGNLTILDPDVVDESNLTRQGYSFNNVGMLKVDALEKHLMSINGGLNYQGLNQDFTKMDSKQLDAIFKDADLLLFLTDSFPAQAFGNKIALRYQKPAIWAGFYAGSRCSEIVFTIPNVTPACFRCAVSPRYAAQAQKSVNVSSQLNTIFHSQFLDALIGMLSMAILHNDTEGFEYSNWFGKSWDRNLLQTNVHPDYILKESRLFFDTFKKGNNPDRIFNFNTIFQKIEAEKPPKYECCPDCGGNGYDYEIIK
jgi:proteasome lid subunit RPN8/RPN11